MKKKEKKIKKKTKHPRAKKLFTTLLVFAAIAFVAFLVINSHVKTSVEGYILLPDETAELDVDCILILGAGVRDDGSPSHMLEDRLLRGIEVYSLGASDRLLMSGDHGREGYDEVNTMKDFAIARFVPSEAIFMDHAGFSTYESLYRAGEIFGAKKIVIVTQGYHLYRALYVARSLGLDAYGVSADLRTYRGQEYFDLRESAARVKDFFTVIFKPEPTYLGESIPINGNGDITNDK